MKTILAALILSLAAAAHAAPRLGEPAPDFTLSDTAGKPVVWNRRAETLLEHIALHELLYGCGCHEFDQINEREFIQPVAVAFDLDFAKVQNFRCLLFPCSKVFFNLLFSEHWTCLIFAGWITNLYGAIADQ